MRKISGEITSRTVEADSNIEALYVAYMELLPQMGPNWNRHSPLGIMAFTYARMLYNYEIYSQILDVPGVICEFGVHWGTTLVNFTNLRTLLEPFNQSRTIVGFDTFQGFTSLERQDGQGSSVGDFGTTENFATKLSHLLSLHESVGPASHLRKHELVQGDASVTFKSWLEENPQAIVAMAVFDMDLYKPTRDVLEMVLPRLTKGSLLVFDELNVKHFPGETIAVQEVIGVSNLKLRKSSFQSNCSWAVWDG